MKQERNSLGGFISGLGESYVVIKYQDSGAGLLSLNPETTTDSVACSRGISCTFWVTEDCK